jgi:ribosomal protein L11 methyltransferase
MHQKISAGPKRDLYIYFLKGRLKAESGMFQNNFIGNWEEEDDSFLFFSSDVIAYPADLVIANIHYDVMRHLKNTKGFLDKKRFILSGLLRSEAKEIADSLARLPVKIIKQWARDGIWHAFYGQMAQDGSYNSQ